MTYDMCFNFEDVLHWKVLIFFLMIPKKMSQDMQ